MVYLKLQREEPFSWQLRLVGYLASLDGICSCSQSVEPGSRVAEVGSLSVNAKNKKKQNFLQARICYFRDKFVVIAKTLEVS